jgi:DNA-binding HxlR family transcriptional regulator
MGTLDPEQFKEKIASWTEKDHPIKQFLSRIADKWSFLVVSVLSKKPGQRCRFSQLKRDIPGISQRMLTTTLRKLEQDGLLTRHFYPEIPPRVEYELTELGKSLRAPLKSLFDWVRENWPAAQKFREDREMKDNPK